MRVLCASRIAATCVAATLIGLLAASPAAAQLPSALYTWDDSGNVGPNIEGWVKNFGSNSATFDNTIAGSLRLIETGGTGAGIAFSDGANRVRESSTAASGGTDVTGLDWLEFDLGHNGSGPINVQFYVQASTGFDFVALGPDLAVTPGMNTYQVPLTGLTPAQAVYLRTIGFNARDHLAVGDVVWTLDEVRAGGTPLTVRDLITHDAGTPEGGLQGAIVNFDGASVAGNGGQNQSGLSHNPAGSGSLQWTDVAGGAGGAISWGNGTAWNGNSFNLRSTDLTGYKRMIVTMSASDPTNGGGSLSVGGFFQTNNFQFQSAGGQTLAVDGQFHDLVYDLAGLVNMNVVDQTGINLGSHAQNLVINVDRIRFVVPEPASAACAATALVGLAVAGRRRRA